MSYTRNEEKAPSSQFFSKPNVIPVSPAGASAIASEMLPQDIKKSPVGKLSHGLGNVVALTEAIATYRHNVSQGKTPASAGIGAMASFVIEKLVEGAGAGLITAGAAVALTASAPIVAPALAISSGVLLMMKAKESGNLANLAAPILAEDSLDKFRALKSSMLQLVKTSYQKLTSDSTSSSIIYPNIETVMVKLDYLQQLKNQGIYIHLDENQELLYNWIARETFAGYFQLDSAGKLKAIKPTENVEEVKLNSDTVKLELTSIYTSLAEVQKQCQLTPEAILGSKSIITDEEIGQFFLAHGASPEEVTSLYDNKEHLTIARCAITHLKEQQAKLACTLDTKRSLEIIQGTQHFFGALTQVGMFARSEALMTVGQIGYNTMQMASSIVKLSTTPIGFASMEPMSMLLSAGLNLISTVLGFGDGSGELEQKRAEQLQSALYTISRQIEELHTRFDHIERMIQSLAGMINQVLHNQKILSDQLHDTYKLVRTGFHVIQIVLHDMRAENRWFNERIHSQLTYLISMAEQDGLQQFREEIESKINYIYRTATEEDIPEARVELLRREFLQLESDIRKTCSGHRNGQKVFSAQQRSEAPRDLQLARQFLSGRLADKDDGLGFIAEEIEQMTKIPFTTAGVKKELLPATALWSMLVSNYFRLAQLPLFVSLHNPSFIAEINAQADNLLKFIQYLKTHKVIELLLKNHHASIKELQGYIFERFTMHKQLLLEDKKSEAKRMSVEDYFSAGEDKALFDKMKHKINYQYFLLQRIASITGASSELQQQLALQDRGIDLMAQAFDFNERPEAVPDLRYAIGYYEAIQTAYSPQPWHYSYPYMHEALEKFGGLLYGSPGEEKMLFVTTLGYSSDWSGGANISLTLNQLDIRSGKPTPIYNIHPHNPEQPTFPLYKYKGNWNQTANQVWASFDIAHSSVWSSSPKELVWFSGGSGYVSVFDISKKEWSTIPDQKPFHVPLDYAHTAPKMTCYTHLFNKNNSSHPYLLVAQIEWNKTIKNEKKDYIGEAYVRFEISDLQEKWLDADEINTLFNRKVGISESKVGWTLTGSDAAPTPNQFFIKIMKRYGFSILKDEVIYGLIKPKKDNMVIEMHYCKIKPSEDALEDVLKPEGLEVITKSLPIALSQIYQTASENVIVNGDSILTIISSVKTKDGKNKLLFINADIFKRNYETHECELPPVHQVADWQAMRTIVVNIMDKPHIIVTLLDPDYRMMIFSFDPAAKKVMRLSDGPTLEFITPDNRVDMRCDIDYHLKRRRNQYPGFYPVNTISLQTRQLDGMDTLIISYPKPCGSSAYRIQVQRYPLAPALRVKSTKEAQTRLISPEEKALTTPSKLALSAQLAQQLLNMNSERKSEVKADISRENILLPAIESCKKIQRLISMALKEFKFSDECAGLIREETQAMNTWLAALEDSQGVKNGITKLKELYETMIQLNGYLNFNEKYALSVGKSVAQQIDQLKEKLSDIQKRTAPVSGIATKNMFSGRSVQLRKEVKPNAEGSSSLVNVR